MIDVVVNDLTEQDIAIMAKNMRPMDQYEFDLMSGGKAHADCLQHLLARSRRARAAYVDGQLVACYGVLSPTLLSTDGNPWLAATDMIDRKDVRREFIKRTKDELIWLSAGFSSLWNLVSDQNKIAIRWLSWAGFEFTGDAYDVRDGRFIKFHMGE